RIDRLEPGKRAFDLAVAPEPPPPPSGSPAAPQMTAFKLKQQKKIIHELAQPQHIEDKTPVDDTPPGIGTGTGTGTRSGSGPGSGSCTTPPCGPGEGKEPPFDESICQQQATVFVPPAVIKGMRISGETQIYPSDIDKTAIVHSGKQK